MFGSEEDGIQGWLLVAVTISFLDLSTFVCPDIGGALTLGLLHKYYVLSLECWLLQPSKVLIKNGGIYCSRRYRGSPLGLKEGG